MKKTVLKNGMTIITNNNDNYDTVAMCYMFNCGSYNENEKERGIAHLVEHMLFKGTINRDFCQISKDMENIGGTLNACTGMESTQYYCILPSDKWKEGLEIISDVVWCNTIPEEQLEKEKSVVVEELIMYHDDPRSLAMENLFIDMFEKEENRQSIGGTPASVSKMTRQDIINFINKYYHYKNCYVIASGKINHDDFVNYVENFISDVELDQPTPFKLKELKKPEKMKNTKEIKEIDQSHISFGMFAPVTKEFDSCVFDLICVMLGGNSSSRLFHLIREELGLAYQVKSYRRYMTDCSILMGYVGLNKKNIDSVKKLIKEEILKFTDKNNIEQSELDRARNYLKGAIKIDNETTWAQINFIADSLINEIDLNIDEYLNKLDKVTLDDVARCMTEYCKGDFLNFSEVLQKC